MIRRHYIRLKKFPKFMTNSPKDDIMSVRESTCLHDWRTANADHESLIHDIIKSLKTNTYQKIMMEIRGSLWQSRRKPVTQNYRV